MLFLCYDVHALEADTVLTGRPLSTQSLPRGGRGVTINIRSFRHKTNQKHLTNQHCHLYRRQSCFKLLLFARLILWHKDEPQVRIRRSRVLFICNVTIVRFLKFGPLQDTVRKPPDFFLESYSENW